MTRRRKDPQTLFDQRALDSVYICQFCRLINSGNSGTAYKEGENWKNAEPKKVGHADARCPCLGLAAGRGDARPVRWLPCSSEAAAAFAGCWSGARGERVEEEGVWGEVWKKRRGGVQTKQH